MKHILQITLACAALNVSGSSLSAQPAKLPDDPGLPRHAGAGPARDQLKHRQAHGPRIVAVLDLDRDGVISASELAHAPSALLTLDKNGDGQLDLSEVGPGAPRRPGQPPPPPPALLDHTTDTPLGPPPAHVEDEDGEQAALRPVVHLQLPLLTALDANRDRVLDAAEIKSATGALRALDKNGDGQLTPDEYRPERQPNRAGVPRGPRHAPLPPAE